MKKLVALLLGSLLFGAGTAFGGVDCGSNGGIVLPNGIAGLYRLSLKFPGIAGAFRGDIFFDGSNPCPGPGFSGGPKTAISTPTILVATKKLVGHADACVMASSDVWFAHYRMGSVAPYIGSVSLTSGTATFYPINIPDCSPFLQSGVFLQMHSLPFPASTVGFVNNNMSWTPEKGSYPVTGLYVYP